VRAFVRGPAASRAAWPSVRAPKAKYRVVTTETTFPEHVTVRPASDPFDTLSVGEVPFTPSASRITEGEWGSEDLGDAGADRFASDDAVDATDIADATDADDVEPTPEPGAGFRRFGLSDRVMQAIVELGYQEPTPIQAATIDLLLRGRDLIGQAQTGTGKTAAYGIPILDTVDPSVRRTQALVLAPTRELALQVSKVLAALGRHRGVGVVPVYGGQSYEVQFRAFRAGAHVIVGTPGRLIDHIKRGTIDLANVGIVVLDEADEMLDMGFFEDVESILKTLPGIGTTASSDSDARPAVQVALFSATMPNPVVRLAGRFMQDPAHVTVEATVATVPRIAQVAYDLGRMDKTEALGRILDVEAPGPTIVFCATRRTVDEVAEALQGRGHRTAGLHGEMAQGERERVMRRFRDGAFDVLVATDLAARGLDIASITHVVNYDLPWDAEVYVHRIGRTGRAGREGDAITLVAPRDGRSMRQIEMTLRVRIPRKRPPALAEVSRHRRAAALDTVAGVANGDGLEIYGAMVDDLLERAEPRAIAAAALRMWDQARSANRDGATIAAIVAAAAREAEAMVHEAQVNAERARVRVPGGSGGFARLRIEAGRDAGIRPQDVVGTIAAEADVPGRAVGAIRIFDQHTIVAVAEDLADQIIEALTLASIRGRPAQARYASLKEIEEATRQGYPQGGGGGGRSSAPRGYPSRGRDDWRPGGQQRAPRPESVATRPDRTDGYRPDHGEFSDGTGGGGNYRAPAGDTSGGTRPARKPVVSRLVRPVVRRRDA
jgi:ATP-dependent RNA helicase DeaD